MCSIMTMASSMIRPIAAAMPPSVMMLKLWPRTFSTRVVAASDHGHGDDGGQRHPPVAQENQEHQRGQHDADDDGVAQAPRPESRISVALIVPGLDVHVGRPLACACARACLDLLGDLDRIAAGLLVDVHQHGVAAIGRDADPLRRRRGGDGGDVADADHRAVDGLDDLRSRSARGSARAWTRSGRAAACPGPRTCPTASARSRRRPPSRRRRAKARRPRASPDPPRCGIRPGAPPCDSTRATPSTVDSTGASVRSAKRRSSTGVARAEVRL